MTDNYTTVRLCDAIKESGEDAVSRGLSTFSCSRNPDIEHFLHHNAIDFDKKGVSRTQLVYLPLEDTIELVGYFTLTNKTVSIPGANISNAKKKKVRNFSTYDEETDCYQCAAILIGQLGKNYAGGNNQLLSGKDLLSIAINEIRQAQKIIGGRLVYLECEDKPRLVSFYEANLFEEFNRRALDKDEDTLSGHQLIQLLRILEA